MPVPIIVACAHVLRIQNVQTGRHMYIGLAFNERNDAFDFNTSLEDSRREKESDYKAELLAKEMELLGVTTNDNTANGQRGSGGSSGRGVGGMNYTMKEGEKIHVKIPILTNNKNYDNDNNVDDDDTTTTILDGVSLRYYTKPPLQHTHKQVSRSYFHQWMAILQIILHQNANDLKACLM